MLKLDALLEAIIGNLVHIMLTFEWGLAHVTKHFFLGFLCSHILAACHCQSDEFQQFVQGYYTTRAYLSI